MLSQIFFKPQKNDVYHQRLDVRKYKLKFSSFLATWERWNGVSGRKREMGRCSVSSDRLDIVHITHWDKVFREDVLTWEHDWITFNYKILIESVFMHAHVITFSRYIYSGPQFSCTGFHHAVSIVVLNFHYVSASFIADIFAFIQFTNFLKLIVYMIISLKIIWVTNWMYH